MTKLILLMAASLLALAPQIAQASSGNENMSGLDEKGTVGSVPAKVQAQEEDDLDKQIAQEKERARKLKELEDLRAKNKQQAEKLAQDENNEKAKKTVGEKVVRETARVANQVTDETNRVIKKIKKKF